MLGKCPFRRSETVHLSLLIQPFERTWPVLGGNTQKQKILIVDDSEMNRSLLADMLGDEYDILEAEDGLEAITILQKHLMEISLVLLDVVMPKMDGFEVLTVMNQNHWIEDIPVIMISAESGPSKVAQAYELGVTDFIMRPFDVLIVRRRVINTIFLYAKQKHLVGMVYDQIRENQKISSMMIDILSHIVEFRNGESGAHILHVRTMTETLLHQLQKKNDSRYPITPMDVSVISVASALHDIGKIAIDEKILNKPGKLTEEEFAIMKTHSLIGAEILNKLPAYQEEPLVKTAYEICRWHHERYDGRGYPDGLKGDAIPISAQTVALADVYDALTSERVYKEAFSREKALDMIFEGQCGAFNPLLLECLSDVSEQLEDMVPKGHFQEIHFEINGHPQDMTLQSAELAASERSLRLMDYERMKHRFFAAITEEIQFEYTVTPPMLVLSDWGAKKLGIDEVILNPKGSEQLARVMGADMWDKLSAALRATTPEDSVVRFECPLCYNGQCRWHQIIAKAIWSSDDPPIYVSAIGKAVDIHDTKLKLEELEKQASLDSSLPIGQQNSNEQGGTRP